MGKGNKNKKDKVPKITEEEYTAYLTALKVGEEKTEEDGALSKSKGNQEE